MPRLSQLIFGLSSRRSSFEPSPVYVRLCWTKCHWDKFYFFFFYIFCWPCISIYLS